VKGPLGWLDRPWVSIDQLIPECESYAMGPAGHTELLEQGPVVGLDRRFREVERAGDLVETTTPVGPPALAAYVETEDGIWVVAPDMGDPMTSMFVAGALLAAGSGRQGPLSPRAAIEEATDTSTAPDTRIVIPFLGLLILLIVVSTWALWRLTLALDDEPTSASRIRSSITEKEPS